MPRNDSVAEIIYDEGTTNEQKATRLAVESDRMRLDRARASTDQSALVVAQLSTTYAILAVAGKAFQ